jgi:hypothetical protein
MSEQLYVSVNGHPCSSARLTVGYVGPWQCEVELPHDDVLTHPTRVQIGALTLVGVPLPSADGTYASQRRARIVGGAAAWSNNVPRKGYHNDAGVKAREVADDAARECGETLGSFIPTSERIGADFAREAGPASSALEAVIGSTAWWVGYDGLTNVGPRPAHTPAPDSYTILAYDPAGRVATLTADDPSAVQVGSTLLNGLDAPGVVRELEIEAGGQDKLRMHVWLGGTAQDPGRLAGLFTSIIQRTSAAHLFGAYRYRVVTQAADERLDLQAVDRELGLPDLKSITPCPGVAGVHGAVPASGQVLVMFAEGDRSRPFVVAYAPFGTDGFVLSGQATSARAARVGDAVSSGGAGTLVTFGPVPGGAPTPMILGVAYLVSFNSTPPTPVLAAKLSGAITKGSSMVQIGGDST